MKKQLIKLIGLILIVCITASIFAACSEKPEEKVAAEYTYRGYSTALGNNWNPHTWETNADNTIQDYLSMPFCTMSIKDSENGVYQWVYEMATSVEDVTEDHKDDLTKYNVTLPSGKTADEVTEGYVFEIKLNPDAKWEDGTVINADSYIYSMQQLLNSKMRNYRANLYYSGESAVAGGLAYYNSEAPIYLPMVPAYEDEGDYSYDLEAGIANGEVYINLSSAEMTLYSMSLNDLHSTYGVGDDADYTSIKNAENAFGYTKITNENKETALKLINDILTDLFGITDEAELADYVKEALFVNKGEVGEKVEYDAVGCYKVDDLTIRYVCQTSIDYNYFLTSCTSTWLVYETLYEAGKDTTGELITTDYCTSKETTMSYGPYKLSSYEDGKQIVFVQNESWYGWTENDDGSLTSTTNFEVDGKKIQQYQTTKVIIDVMDDATAKQMFLKGDLNDWTPNADDLIEYSSSSRLYQIDETYTMSLFFDCDLEDLKAMDESKGNQNSVVLSNINFREAFSLAIDRSEWVKTTEGYKPSYGLMNTLYYYDVYNDPTSSYRGSDAAMQAICDLYGVEYGDGKLYTTLKEAYKSINGYNLTEAKELMKTACDELVAAELYTAGEPIVIRIAWMKGALDTPAQNQCSAIEGYLNAAIEGSGFGAITLEPYGSLNDRYGDVGTRGDYAIGYGAWGGAAFYPFRNLQVYCDNGQYSLHE
ncbi:MAG: ABC transporter substrate-binding protein, partial [Eubacteriales bacterium]|nr:ABC transporter substrate-binding protein [Eubacteriales bacterium]